MSPYWVGHATTPRPWPGRWYLPVAETRVQWAKGGLDLRRAASNRAGGFHATHTQKGLFTAGLMPNLPEHLWNRTRMKRRRTRCFHAV